MDKHTHEWDKPGGTVVRMSRLIGKSPRVRRCIACGRIEQFENGPVFFGWYEATPYAAGCARKLYEVTQ